MTPTAACCRLGWRRRERGGRDRRPAGDHCHNDTGCAVANTLAAVDAGAMHVQGTINGYGERTGNADLVSVIANLELKYGWPLLPAGALRATRLSHAIAEVTNAPPSARQPYVGLSSFAHKAGLHASAIGRSEPLPAHRSHRCRQRHADARLRHGRPGEYPNQGGGAVRPVRSRPAARITDRLKDGETAGYTYEAADASFRAAASPRARQLPEFFSVQSQRLFTQGHPAPFPNPGGQATDTGCTFDSRPRDRVSASWRAMDR